MELHRSVSDHRREPPTGRQFDLPVLFYCHRKTPVRLHKPMLRCRLTGDAFRLCSPELTRHNGCDQVAKSFKTLRSYEFYSLPSPPLSAVSLTVLVTTSAAAPDEFCAARVATATAAAFLCSALARSCTIRICF